MIRVVRHAATLEPTFAQESQKKILASIEYEHNLYTMSDEKFTASSGGLSHAIHSAIIEAGCEAHRVLVQNGLAMVEAAERSLTTFTFGPLSSSLDEITHGGIWSSELTEIVGPSGCGKTQLVLQIAGQTACCKEIPCKVLYIDTSLAFNPDRLMEMHRHWAMHDNHIVPFAQMLKQIQFVQAADSFELLSVLEKTRATLVRQHTEYAQQLRMIIIDSIAAVVSPIIGVADSRGHVLLSEISFMLKAMARRFNLAVIVTNNVVANRASEVRSDILPALGEYWSHSPDTRITLRELGDPINDIEEKDRKVNHRRSLAGKLDKSAKFDRDECEEVLLNIRAMGVTNVSTAVAAR